MIFPCRQVHRQSPKSPRIVDIFTDRCAESACRADFELWRTTYNGNLEEKRSMNQHHRDGESDIQPLPDNKHLGFWR